MTTTPLRRLALACALLIVAPAAANGAAAAKATAAPKARATAKPGRPAAPPAAPEAATRRLDDVHIEGELEVPRVTFITVRQPHRFTDYARATSVRPARRMAADATVPAWISPPTPAASDARKENRK